MKKIILFVAAFLTFVTSYSQQKTYKNLIENTKELSKRPLKVVYLEDSKDKNEEYNQFIKSAIESEWTLNEDISFISYDEYKNFKKQETSEFTFLVIKSSISSHTTKKSNAQILEENGGKMKYDASTLTRTRTVNSPGLTLIGYDKKGKEIQTLSYDICYNNSCKLVDYYFTVQNLQFLLTGLVNAPDEKIKMKDARAMMKNAQKAQQENIKKLKTMTLYVNEKSLSETLKNDFKKYYKFDYKIVPVEEIENAVTQNNQDIAILQSDKISSADTGFPLLSFMDASKMKGFKVNVEPVVSSVEIFKDLFLHEIQKKDLERLKEVLQ